MNIYRMRISDVQEYVNFIKEENLKLKQKNEDLNRINDLYRTNLKSKDDSHHVDLLTNEIQELKNQIALMCMRLPIDIKV